MFTKNLVRVLGVVVGVSSVLIACAPDEGASVNTKGGLSPECNPLLDRNCVGGVTFDPKLDPKKGEDPKEESKGGDGYKPVYSVCAPGLFVYLANIENPSEEKIPGYQRLVEFDEKTGTIPCVHPEEGKATTCKMNREIAKDHKWTVFSEKSGEPHTFIKAGLTINRDGTWNKDDNGFQWGEYVVGAPAKAIVDKRTGQIVRYEVRCLPPSGKDTAGTLAEADYAEAFIVERFNSDQNAAVEDDGTRKKHINYADEVCAAKNNDAVNPGTPKSGSIWCWKGTGAALNDALGIERNDADVYYPEPDRSHVTISVGIETPAAKRVPSSGTKFLENYPQRWMIPSPFPYGN